MMRLIILFISTCFVIYPLMTYADDYHHDHYHDHERFDVCYRTIKNSSAVSWVINRSSCMDHHTTEPVIFDYALTKVPASCAKGSVLVNGPCILPPGKTTYLKYNHQGKLVFASAHVSKSPIYVKYTCYEKQNSLFMNSTNESRINDNHGNITIYPGAEY